MNKNEVTSEPCTFKLPPSGAANVESKASIEAWRTEKSNLDRASDVHDVLGCVGEPLANLLRNLVERYDISYSDRVEIIDRATEARGNLLDWTNEHRQSAYNEGISDAAAIAGQCEVTDCLPDDLATCTLEEATEHARDYIERELDGITCYGGAECRPLSDEDLT